MQPNLTNEILREYSRRSFYNFFKLFWNAVETAEFQDNYHIELICNELQKRYEIWEDWLAPTRDKDSFYDLLINLPPGSSKSLIISVFFPAWIWLNNPSVKIITASYSHKIAEELSGKSLRLMQSELYQRMIKFKLDSIAVNNIKNSKGGQRFVTSTNGTVTGIHADIIICDDINSPQSIFSESDREQTRKFLQEILPSRITNPKRSYSIYVQQRLHNDDGTGVVLKSKRKLKHICIPAINENGESFFPTRFSLEFLNSMREQLGTTSFMAQYQQVTQDAQGGIIKKSWIKELITENKPCTYFIDSAYGGANADFNAIIGAYKEQNNLIIQMCEINKYEFPELIKWLLKNIPVNSKIYIEGKASGKSIIQTLKKETSFNIIEIQPKGAKLERKNAVSPYFEAGRIVINQYINYKNEIIEQIIYDNTKHDDIMDVITYAIESLLKVNKGQYNII
jgi:predicted phage terminase large subunit-like protein